MRNGIDFSLWRTTPLWLKQNGFSFVVRYLSWLPADADKVIAQPEFDDYRANGIDVVLNWEYQGHQDVLGGFDNGRIQAAEAGRQALMLGAWPCVVYFSCDWDVVESEQPVVNSYLNGCGTVLGGPQYVGVYGGYWCVKRAMEAGVANWGWQTIAWSGSPTIWYPGAQLRQVEVGVANDTYDRDEAQVAGFGQVGMPITSTTPVVSPVDPPTILEEDMKQRIFVAGGTQRALILAGGGLFHKWWDPAHPDGGWQVEVVFGGGSIDENAGVDWSVLPSPAGDQVHALCRWADPSAHGGMYGAHAWQAIDKPGSGWGTEGL